MYSICFSSPFPAGTADSRSAEEEKSECYLSSRITIKVIQMDFQLNDFVLRFMRSSYLSYTCTVVYHYFIRVT